MLKKLKLEVSYSEGKGYVIDGLPRAKTAHLGNNIDTVVSVIEHQYTENAGNISLVMKDVPKESAYKIERIFKMT